MRRSFYPSTNPAADSVAKEHATHATDNLADPDIDPYQVGRKFTYYGRWTNEHFAFFRLIVRAMCMDAGDELKVAWKQANENKTAASWAFTLPAVKLKPLQGEAPPQDVQVTWSNAPDLTKKYDGLEVARAMMAYYRDQYTKAK